MLCSGAGGLLCGFQSRLAGLQLRLKAVTEVVAAATVVMIMNVSTNLLYSMTDAGRKDSLRKSTKVQTPWNAMDASVYDGCREPSGTYSPHDRRRATNGEGPERRAGGSKNRGLATQQSQ